mmetsp:Transcript_117248/g.336369  ORF Transcript_117248/g.336369 Transcript_117248/m.336369 type:complete len:177 (-) Transcript_117248:183-713(-)
MLRAVMLSADPSTTYISETLNEDRATLIINALSSQYEVVHATAGWHNFCGEPCHGLSDIFDSMTAASFRRELQDLIVNARNGCWDLATCAFTMRKVTLALTDGSTMRVRMRVTVPHPKHMKSDMYPARVSFMKLRAVKAPGTVMGAIKEDVPYTAGLIRSSRWRQASMRLVGRASL